MYTHWHHKAEGEEQKKSEAWEWKKKRFKDIAKRSGRVVNSFNPSLALFSVSSRFRWERKMFWDPRLLRVSIAQQTEKRLRSSFTTVLIRFEGSLHQIRALVLVLSFPALTVFHGSPLPSGSAQSWEPPENAFIIQVNCAMIRENKKREKFAHRNRDAFYRDNDRDYKREIPPSTLINWWSAYKFLEDVARSIANMDFLHVAFFMLLLI